MNILSNIPRPNFSSPLARRMLLMLAIMGSIFLLLCGYIWLRSVMIKRYLAASDNPVQTVSVSTAVVTEWKPRIKAIGTLKAANGADLALETSGIVEKLYFKSGEDVAIGQVLLELNKGMDLAQLESFNAAVELAEQTYRRDAAQLKLHAVSQATVDSDLSNLKKSRAQVSQQEAILSQKILRAPFAGRLGISKVDLGQYLGQGSIIVTLQQLDPIYIDFVVPQKVVSRVKSGQEIEIQVDAFPSKSFKGVITAISSKVDTSSRNIEVRASVANPERNLLPGMFAQIEIEAGSSERFVTLPQTAIVYEPYGNSVYIIEKDSADKKTSQSTGFTARQSFVQLGNVRGDQVAVHKGVSPGVLVVVAGQLKLRNGTAVKIENKIQLPNDPTPTLHDK